MIANRKEAAKVFRISEPTLDRWIDDGCPVVEKGGHGRSYMIDLDQVEAWREKVLEEAAVAQAEREKKLSEFQNQLDLDLGQNDEDQGRLKLTKEYYETEAKRMDLEIRRGGLVRAGDVEKVFLDVFGMLSERLQSLPDYLERAAGLDAQTTILITEQVSAWQTELAQDLGTLESDDDDDDDSLRALG